MKAIVLAVGDYHAGIDDHLISLDLGDFDAFESKEHRKNVDEAIKKLYLAMYGGDVDHVYFEDQCHICFRAIEAWAKNKREYCEECEVFNESLSD